MPDNIDGHPLMWLNMPRSFCVTCHCVGHLSRKGLHYFSLEIYVHVVDLSDDYYSAHATFRRRRPSTTTGTFTPPTASGGGPFVKEVNDENFAAGASADGLGGPSLYR